MSARCCDERQTSMLWKSLQLPDRLDSDHEPPHTDATASSSPSRSSAASAPRSATRCAACCSRRSRARRSRPVRIDGVLHEFSTAPGRHRGRHRHHPQPQGGAAQAARRRSERTVAPAGTKGRRRSTAGDIDAGSDVEILNPDHHIATLSNDGKLDMELRSARRAAATCRPSATTTRTWRVGYDPDRRGLLAGPQGELHGRRNARVGQRTDYDKLTLEVWTDGTVAPEDAVALRGHASCRTSSTIFINFEERRRRVAEDAAGRGRGEPVQREPDRRSTSSSSRCARPTASRTPNIQYIGELVQKTESRDAQDQELRPQVAERDQGDPARRWASRSACASISTASNDCSEVVGLGTDEASATGPTPRFQLAGIEP